MDDVTFVEGFIRELELEVAATRKCLERIPPKLFDFKPHERSMNLGYLTLLVAEIPSWIILMVNGNELDFATYSHKEAKTAEEMVKNFDDNVAGAKAALQTVTNGSLSGKFDLKTNGQVVFTSSKREGIETTINHMVHHRGQLTVYMRLNNIMVPSIYGPSADDKNF
jgi:uncharacterized damage-inducible protein DinB